MKFTLDIDCENAAFEDNPNIEIARILEKLAINLRGDAAWKVGDTIRLRDINGNSVGGAAMVGI